MPLAVYRFSSQEVRDRYQQSLGQCFLQHQLNAESSVEDQWKIIKECVLASAEVAVGYAKKQPDWLIDATDILRPLLDDKAGACQRYFQLQNSSAKREFRFRQRLVKRAVDEAKEAWISKGISDTEHCHDGKLRWDCIRRLQTAFHGRWPARSVRLRKLDGNLTMDPWSLNSFGRSILSEF